MLEVRFKHQFWKNRDFMGVKPNGTSPPKLRARIFSIQRPRAFLSNLVWWTQRFFESALYLGSPFFKKGLLFVFLGSRVYCP